MLPEDTPVLVLTKSMKDCYCQTCPFTISKTFLTLLWSILVTIKSLSTKALKASKVLGDFFQILIKFALEETPEKIQSTSF